MMAPSLKILLLGKDGQVGWALQRALAPLGRVVALGRGGQGDLSGDLDDLARLSATVRAVRPAIIVNAAAFTAVDQAEHEPERAQRINADAVILLAEEARRLNSWLVAYSTDYVFDGSGERPWCEADEPHPLSVYGRSKREGEIAILTSGCRYLLFRTSWVYGRGRNFVATILRLAKERERLEVVADQIGAPTGADLIADVTAHALRTALARPEVGGLYHLTAVGETSWHGYARFVVETAEEIIRTQQAEATVALRLEPKAIMPVPTSAYPLPAPRPANSRLDTRHLRNTFGLCLPDWQQGVARYVKECLESCS